MNDGLRLLIMLSEIWHEWRISPQAKSPGANLREAQSAALRKDYVGCRENRYIRSKYKRKTPIGTEENMSDVAEIVIPGVIITGVHCT